MVGGATMLWEANLPRYTAEDSRSRRHEASARRASMVDWPWTYDGVPAVVRDGRVGVGDFRQPAARPEHMQEPMRAGYEFPMPPIRPHGRRRSCYGRSRAPASPFSARAASTRGPSTAARDVHSAAIAKARVCGERPREQHQHGAARALRTGSLRAEDRPLRDAHRPREGQGGRRRVGRDPAAAERSRRRGCSCRSRRSSRRACSCIRRFPIPKSSGSTSPITPRARRS